MECLKVVVQKLPAVNRVSLHRLVMLLNQIAQKSAVNLMPSSNLSIVFTPALLRKSNEVNLIGRSSVDPIIMMIDHATEIFGVFINNYRIISKYIQIISIINIFFIGIC